MSQGKLFTHLRAKLMPQSTKTPLSSSSSLSSNYNYNSSSFSEAIPSTAPYGAHLDRYLHELESHYSFSNEAVIKARKQFEGILTNQSKAKAEHQREYMQTIIPLVFVIALFMREQTNRSCAEQTHLVLKEHADRFSSLKRVVI